MSWLKVDDNFMSHPKVLALGRGASDAITLWLTGAVYASAHLTDGFVPYGVLRLAPLSAAAASRAAEALVRVGLWEESAGGWAIHDYLDYNPPKAKVEAARAVRQARAQAGAEARWHPDSLRDAASIATGMSSSTTAVDAPLPSPPVPASPVPSRPISEDESSSAHHIRAGLSRAGDDLEPDSDLEAVVKAFADRCIHQPTASQIQNGLSDWVAIDGAPFLLAQIAAAPAGISRYDLFGHLEAAVHDRRNGSSL